MLKTGTFVFRLFSVLMLLTLGVTPAHAAGIRYSKPDGIGDCSSWGNACTLQIALTNAISGDEIWVNTGIYVPGALRTDTFQLKNGIAIYGGFTGTETMRNQRNPAANVTTLSGDIGVTGNSDNSYHVVTGVDGATLDGFTITAGNANDVFPNDAGGGMYNYSSSPTLANVTFSGNSAEWGGGGMTNWNSSNPTLTNVTFSGNSAANFGGGMVNTDSSNPILTNVTFSGNSAVSGGGMFNESNSPSLANVTFISNTANDGGGMYNNWHSSSTLMNVTFSGNSAANSGGGMVNNTSSSTLTNVTFSGNSAYVGGGMSNTYSSSPTIRNTIFWGNTSIAAGAQIYNYDIASSPIVSYSVVQGGCPTGSTCTNIITTDPKLGILGDYGGFTQTIPLLVGSSAINTGNNATCAATDQRGITRPQGMHCDIGSYEFVDTTPPTVAITSLAFDPTNASPIAVTVIFSESVTGFTSGDIITSNGTVSAFAGGGASYTFDLTPAGQGLVTANIAAGVATDSAGNGNTAATQFSRTYDTTAPTVYNLFLPLILR